MTDQTSTNESPRELPALTVSIRIGAVAQLRENTEETAPRECTTLRLEPLPWSDEPLKPWPVPPEPPPGEPAVSLPKLGASIRLGSPPSRPEEPLPDPSEAELRRRLWEARPKLRLPEDFSPRVLAPRKGIDPKRHPLIESVFLARTSGMPVPATQAEFHEAIAATILTERQRAVLDVWLCEAPVLDIVKGWLDGAYSLRSVVRALHETRGERGWPANLTETINELAMDDRRSITLV